MPQPAGPWAPRRLSFYFCATLRAPSVPHGPGSSGLLTCIQDLRVPALWGSPATWNSAVQCPLPPRTSGQPPKLKGSRGSLAAAPAPRLPLALAPASPGVPPELHSAAGTRAQVPARLRIAPASRFPRLEGVSSRLDSAGLWVPPQGPQDPPSFGASGPGVIQKLLEYQRQQALYQAGN